MTVNLPRSGDIVRVGLEASVQFDGERAIKLRVIRVMPWTTYTGWVWINGYQLDDCGHAIERRSVFVQISGLRPAEQRVTRRVRALAAIPRQRTTTTTPTGRTR